MLGSWVFGLLFVPFSAELQQPPDPPAPVPIVGGTDVQACDFPAAVALLNGGGGQFCTGILVHPRVVLLAAHCLDNQVPSSVAFGESVAAPEQTVAVASCVAHPDYVPGPDEQLNEWDIGFCELASDAPDVPIVPPLMGCEAEQLVPDVEVTLVGFGLNNEQAGTGNTQKRRTVNTVQVVDEVANDLILLGVDDSSACFGDSGGPAYMQLSDGTWRVVGITSEPHPDVVSEPLVCGYGVIYELVHPDMAWFEATSGYDLTPCFDADGLWNAGEDCGGFPMSLDDGGDWMNACATRSLSENSSTCGEPFGVAGTSTGGDTGTQPDTEGPPDGTSTTGGLSSGTGLGSSGTDDDSGSTTGPGGPEATTTDPGPATQTGGSGDSGAGAEEDGDSGCGCRSSRRGPGAWLLLLCGGVAVRRRG